MSWINFAKMVQLEENLSDIASKFVSGGFNRQETFAAKVENGVATIDREEILEPVLEKDTQAITGNTLSTNSWFLNEEVMVVFYYKSSTSKVHMLVKRLGTLSGYVDIDTGLVSTSPTNYKVAHFIRNGEHHFHVIYGKTTPTNTIFYRRLNFNTATFEVTLDPERTAYVSPYITSAARADIVSDNNGLPWIGVYESNDNNIGIAIALSSTTNDGTWSTRAGFPFTLESGGRFHATPTFPTLIGPNKVYFIWRRELSGTSEGRLWDNGAWGTQEVVHSMLPSTNDTSAISFEDGVLLYYRSNVMRRRDISGAWSTVSIPSEAPAGNKSLSKDNRDGTIRMIWYDSTGQDTYYAETSDYANTWKMPVLLLPNTQISTLKANRDSGYHMFNLPKTVTTPTTHLLYLLSDNKPLEGFVWIKTNSDLIYAYDKIFFTTLVGEGTGVVVDILDENGNVLLSDVKSHGSLKGIDAFSNRNLTIRFTLSRVDNSKESPKVFAPHWIWTGVKDFGGNPQFTTRVSGSASTEATMIFAEGSGKLNGFTVSVGNQHHVTIEIDGETVMDDVMVGAGSTDRLAHTVDWVFKESLVFKNRDNGTTSSRMNVFWELA